MSESPTKMTLSGLLAAVPDFFTAAAFGYIWLHAPARPSMVGTLMLVMLIEFLVVHSAGFLGIAVYSDKSRSAKAKLLVGIGAFYALFVLAFSTAFDAWWPIFWLGWLLFSKLMVIWLARMPTLEQKKRMMGQWAAGVFFYVMGAFVTLLPVVPKFSLTPDFVATLNLAGSGLWIDEPHRVIAFGVIYFIAMGITKIVLLRTKQ